MLLHLVQMFVCGGMHARVCGSVVRVHVCTFACMCAYCILRKGRYVY